VSLLSSWGRSRVAGVRGLDARESRDTERPDSHNTPHRRVSLHWSVLRDDIFHVVSPGQRLRLFGLGHASHGTGDASVSPSVRQGARRQVLQPPTESADAHRANDFGLVGLVGGVHDQSDKDQPALGDSDGNELARHPDQGCKRIRFHLLHNVPAVKLNSAFADSQFKRGLLIQQTVS
jgi:hypothetical protein